MGFTLSPGGVHNGGYSHNALIHFKDGTFLELFAFRPGIKTSIIRLADKLGFLEKKKKNPKLGYMPRFMKGLHGKEGIMDFAMLLEDIDEYLGGISYRKIGPALTFSRMRPDGIELSWKLAFPEDLELPFLMSPYEPPQTVPAEKTQHKNGAIGIRQLDIAVKNWDLHFQHYLDLLKTTPQIGREAREPKARFSLKDQDIVLKSATEEAGIQKIYLVTEDKTALGKEIDRRNIRIQFVGE